MDRSIGAELAGDYSNRLLSVEPKICRLRGQQSERGHSPPRPIAIDVKTFFTVFGHVFYVFNVF